MRVAGRVIHDLVPGIAERLYGFGVFVHPVADYKKVVFMPYLFRMSISVCKNSIMLSPSSFFLANPLRWALLGVREVSRACWIRCFQTPTVCFQAQSVETGVKSGWILLLNFGIAAASARSPKRRSQTNTSVGAKSMATISAKQRRMPFTKKPAGTLVSCQSPKRPGCSWNKLYSNSGQLLRRLLLSSRKCNHWLPRCQNIPLSWIC